MISKQLVTALFSALVFLLGTPAFAQNPGTGGSVSVTIASNEAINVLVVSGNVTVSAGVVVQAQATYLKVNTPRDENGKPTAAKIKKVTWVFYHDRNGNGEYDEGDERVDHGTSDGPSYDSSFLLGNLTVNRGSDNQRIQYKVEGENADGTPSTITRDTALGGVL